MQRITGCGVGWRTGLVLAGAFLLMAAEPSGCADLDQVGMEDEHLDPTSPDAADATAQQPLITTRDNPRFLGQMWVESAEVSSSPAGSYAHAGSWSGLGGLLQLVERKANGIVASYQKAPVLPQEGLPFEGAGAASWESRSGDLVHGNTYEASLMVGAPQQSITSEAPLHLKLSDDVHLVPIVVINWKRPGDDPTFVDWTHRAKNAFDFIPYVEPAHMEGQLNTAQTYWVNQNGGFEAPDLVQAPPDEVFGQCGVQFQVVASFTFEVPADFQVGCAGNTPSYKSLNEIDTRVRAAGGAWGDALVEILRPSYLVYADMRECTGWDGYLGYLGKWVSGVRVAPDPYPHLKSDVGIIEIHSAPTATHVTAHELGHMLGLSHVDGSQHPDNLMLEAIGTVVEPWQCEIAYAGAANRSERFRNYNAHVGRIDPEMGAPAIDDISDGEPVQIELAPVCCELSRGGGTFLSHAVECALVGTPTVDSACRSCCVLGGDVQEGWTEDCAPTAIVEDAQCDQDCCSAGPKGVIMSRYQCEGLGGMLQGCPIERN